MEKSETVQKTGKWGRMVHTGREKGISKDVIEIAVFIERFLPVRNELAA